MVTSSDYDLNSIPAVTDCLTNTRERKLDKVFSSKFQVFQLNSMLSLKNTYQQSAPLLIDQSVSRKKKKMQPLKFSN